MSAFDALLTTDGTNRIIIRDRSFSPDEVLEAANRYEDAKIIALADYEQGREVAHEKSSAARDEAMRELEDVTAPTMSWQDALALSDALAVVSAQARRAILQQAEVANPWFAPEPAATGDRFGLTPRESEIFTLLADGVSRSDIAARLFVSPNTIRTHVQSVLRKTGTNSALAAVAALRKAGAA